MYLKVKFYYLFNSSVTYIYCLIYITSCKIQSRRMSVQNFNLVRKLELNRKNWKVIVYK